MSAIDRMAREALERLRRQTGTRAGIACARIRQAAKKLRKGKG